MVAVREQHGAPEIRVALVIGERLRELKAQNIESLAVCLLFAFLHPGNHAIMMMATGFGLAIMTPAVGINYLYQRKSLKLFLIDAGHFVVGMTVVGLVFVLAS